ncbi:MAG: hypothetical protein P8J14_04845 [Emcibacteraceae bacterium]|nr:hypothetical protein [Emcibacteraceae bacterium]
MRIFLQMLLLQVLLTITATTIYMAQTTFMVACATSEDQVDRCSDVDDVFICTDKRRKKIINNDIYSSCVRLPL